MGIEPTSSAWKAVALPLSYTRLLEWRVASGESEYLFTRHSLLTTRPSLGDGGFEPPKSVTADLQSAPFDHSGNPPIVFCKADDGTRTRNLLITNQLLYRLSYASIVISRDSASRWHSVEQSRNSAGGSNRRFAAKKLVETDSETGSFKSESIA